MRTIAAFALAALASACFDPTFGILSDDPPDDPPGQGSGADAGAPGDPDAAPEQTEHPLAWGFGESDIEIGETHDLVFGGSSTSVWTYNTTDNTVQLSFTLPGPVEGYQTDVVHGVRILVVHSFTLTPDTYLRVVGEYPLLLIAEDAIDIGSGATIDAGSYYDANQNVFESGAGAEASNCVANAAQSGLGLYAEPEGIGGGGGGGFAGTGGNGGHIDPAGIVEGGSAIPLDSVTRVRAGCPGGAGGKSITVLAEPGRPGGGLHLSAGRIIDVHNNVAITSNGAGGPGGRSIVLPGNGTGPGGGGAGGGSGGLIVLQAPEVALGSGVVVTTNGGGGGQGAGVPTLGDPGDAGLASELQADGGDVEDAGGIGGSGGALIGVPTSGAGGPSTSHGGGGGGGSAGYILVRTDALDGDGTFSPSWDPI